MFKKQLEDYIFVKNVIPDDVCQLVVDRSLRLPNWQTHFWELYAQPWDSPEKNKELDVADLPIEIQRLLEPYVADGLKSYMDYISSNNSFSGFISHPGIREACPFRMNRYTLESSMSIHHDHIYGIFDGEKKGIPVLSVVGILNQNFQGGEFVFWEDHNMNLKKGDILIFPSNFMYPHRVNKITDGERWSFVTWAF